MMAAIPNRTGACRTMLTFGLSRAKDGWMIRQGLFLLCMLIASLTTASVTHAQEFTGNATIECSGYVHSAGDADQSDGDSDKATPHHHGACHGGGLFMPALGNALAHQHVLSGGILPQAEDALIGTDVDPGLRPPND